jgi:hypothetical protein
VANDLKELLDSPVAFHRILAHVGGGALEGLFLSQALYWTKRTTRAEGWFYKTQAEWWEEIALSRKNQETARRKLKAKNLLKEKRMGQSGNLYFRIDLEELASAIKAIIDGEKSEQMELPDSGSSKRTKRAAGNVRNGHSLTTENTTENTAESTASRDDDEISDSSLLPQLIEAGASESRARKAVETNAAEMRRRLSYLQHFTPANPGAWLTTRPNETFTPPKQIAEAAAQTRRDEAAARDVAARRAASAAAAAERATSAQENAKLDQIFEALTATQKKRIETAARAQIGALAGRTDRMGAALSAAIRNQIREKLKNEEM